MFHFNCSISCFTNNNIPFIFFQVTKITFSKNVNKIRRKKKTDIIDMLVD